MKAIIFGANGQDAYYLKQILEQDRIEVISVSRKGDVIIGDVSNYEFVSSLIKENKPDYIFHLAANSKTSHDVWLENHRTICDGTLFILESVKNYCPSCKVFISGSALQFKNDNTPIAEKDLFEATSPYGVSRIHSVYAARYYRSLGLNVYVGYFFNHDSPRRSDKHLNIQIVNTIKQIANGQQATLSIGDLEARKEFGYAMDIMKGVWCLVNQSSVYEAAIGTGVAHSIQDWIDTCCAVLHIKTPIPIIKNENFVSPYSLLVSNPSTINSLGWKHSTSLQQLAELICTK